MTLHQPTFLQPVSGDADLTWSGLELRNLQRSLISMADGFGGARGIIGGTGGALGFTVAQRGAGANFSVDIPAGRALIGDMDVTNGGTAFVWNDGTYNLTTPNAPSSGTEVHRIVLQLRNKLENGTYSTYDFVPVCLPDTGSGTPAEPNSAITIAYVSIAAGQASVQNANITDYRESANTLACYKPATLGRSSGTTTTKDPDLQLNNLAANAIYEFFGMVAYDGGTGGSESDLKFTFNMGSATMAYALGRQSLGSGTANPAVGYGFTDASVVSAQTYGIGTMLAMPFTGTIDTGNAPAFARFAWSKNSSPDSTNTNVYAGSFFRARRIS
jgi:hypothetical protein